MDEGINHCIGQNTINSRGDPAFSRSLKMLMVVAQLFYSGIYQNITGKVKKQFFKTELNNQTPACLGLGLGVMILYVKQRYVEILANISHRTTFSHSLE